MYAAGNNYIDIVDMLLSAGSDVNKQDYVR